MANPGQGPPIGYMSALLNTGDVREFKKEMGQLLEDDYLRNLGGSAQGAQYREGFE